MHTRNTDWEPEPELIPNFRSILKNTCDNEH